MEQLAAPSSHGRPRDNLNCRTTRGGRLTRQPPLAATSSTTAQRSPARRGSRSRRRRSAIHLFVLAALLCLLAVTPSSLTAQSGRRSRPEPSASPAPNTQRPRRAAPARPADNVPGQPATPDAPSTNAPTPTPAPENTTRPPQTNEPAAPADDAAVEVDDGEIVRVNSNLVPVSATVTDTRGKAITDLTVDDFELRVDGQPKPIGGLSHAETPVRMVMLFDNSDSIRSSRDFEKQAAIRFFKSVLRPVDQAAIYSVGSVFDLVQPLTSDVQKLVRTIEHFDKPEGATKLLDAMAHAAEYLRLLPGRKILVIVSDGADTISDLPYDEVLRRVIAADCQVYAVQTGIFDNANLYDLMAVRRLELFSERTGGSVYIPKNMTELDAAFAQISADLAQQYVLSYYPTNEGRDGRFRIINLRVKTRPNLRVRARRGYYPRQSAGQQQSSPGGNDGGGSRFVSAGRDGEADIYSVRSEPPSDLNPPLAAQLELASNSRSTIKLGGPVHGSKNMNPDTSGDTPTRNETDVRVVSSTLKPPEPKLEPPESVPNNAPRNDGPPDARTEAPPDANPKPPATPAAALSRVAAVAPEPTPADELKPTPTPAPTPTPSPQAVTTTTTVPGKRAVTTSPQPSSKPAQEDAPKSPVSAGQLNSKAVSLPKPIYPEVAHRMKIGGAVKVLVLIDEGGRVVSARAESGPLMLREAAVNAARRAKFTPAVVSGRPVPVSGFITYTFGL